ncbi:hypothetical protein EK904_014362 [Melospiza melodia maxima]|nr:hypothetical protein EK904_014362 [Melospiza melodia maxima]
MVFTPGVYLNALNASLLGLFLAWRMLSLLPASLVSRPCSPGSSAAAAAALCPARLGQQLWKLCHQKLSPLRCSNIRRKYREKQSSGKKQKVPFAPAKEASAFKPYLTLQRKSPPSCLAKDFLYSFAAINCDLYCYFTTAEEVGSQVSRLPAECLFLVGQRGICSPQCLARSSWGVPLRGLLEPEAIPGDLQWLLMAERVGFREGCRMGDEKWNINITKPVTFHKSLTYYRPRLRLQRTHLEGHIKLKLPLELRHRAGLTHQQRLCWWLLTWQSKPEEKCLQRQQCLLSPAALQGHKDSLMLLSWGDKKLPDFETDVFLYVLFIAVLKHQSFSKTSAIIFEEDGLKRPLESFQSYSQDFFPPQL